MPLPVPLMGGCTGSDGTWVAVAGGWDDERVYQTRVLMLGELGGVWGELYGRGLGAGVDS